MHKLVERRTWLALLLAIAIFFSVSANLAFAASRVANDTWGGWSCEGLPTKGIPGGTMYSQGCATWDNKPNSFLWASGGTTSSNGGVRAYAIYTYAYGYDHCYPNDPWSLENSTNGTSYNANWNGAGMGVGYFHDCGQNANHTYQIWSEHAWQATSNSGLIIQEGADYF